MDSCIYLRVGGHFSDKNSTMLRKYCRYLFSLEVTFTKMCILISEGSSCEFLRGVHSDCSPLQPINVWLQSQQHRKSPEPELVASFSVVRPHEIFTRNVFAGIKECLHFWGGH